MQEFSICLEDLSVFFRRAGFLKRNICQNRELKWHYHHQGYFLQSVIKPKLLKLSFFLIRINESLLQTCIHQNAILIFFNFSHFPLFIFLNWLLLQQISLHHQKMTLFLLWSKSLLLKKDMLIFKQSCSLTINILQYLLCARY